ncbi:MAG: hypothetical protein GXP49_04585 [Deltaproteobacteria bacterium]|nr:hypothetical protein [Deltaproteobacteria bacterium]
MAVHAFENRGPEPDAGAILAAALRREIIRADIVRLADPQNADAEVFARITRLKASPIAFPTGVAQGEMSVGEYSLAITLDVKVVSKDGRVLFQNKAFSGAGEYLAGPEPIATTENRHRALQRLAEKMMTDLHDAILQGF